MALEISDKTRSLTTKCPSNFYCLTRDKDLMCNETMPMCACERQIEGDGVFVKPASD
ncbi:hypothetical protein BMS3Abin10_02312 [bacterium BMS3Abin10]|nr:hypothetical protein BMS3Abin10_02312 [bacterium BMS3Abin10]GBE38564.1 hypothetical protein BMS3Bbin08_01171 [bacterium BMS3Bbin08]